jgi:predicted DNA-binding transcriptional regulator AlpA
MPSMRTTPKREMAKTPATAPSPNREEELWSIKTVSIKTGLSRASIYRYSACKLFPAVSHRPGSGRLAGFRSPGLDRDEAVICVVLRAHPYGVQPT